ncbi:MAG TPA: cadherin-like domain-containing protein, partial [Actinomycetota bacterium]|nr:cadherin-like domain-containing protein [Actinomycetota bacterium]
VSITVTEVNDAPDAINDAATLAEDSSATAINVLGNDSKGPANEAGQTLTVTSKTNGAHGTVAITGGGTGVSYTPAADYNGPDSFTYTITDNGTTNGSLDAKSDTATVTITVTEVNDAPDAINDAAITDEDTSVLVNVLANDSKGPNESGQTLTITTVGSPSHGSAVVEAGQIRYTPAANYNGPDSFTYTITDNGTTNGAPAPLTDSATVSIAVNPINDPPTIGAGSGTSASAQYSDPIDSDPTTSGAQGVIVSASDIDSASLSASTQWKYAGSYGTQTTFTNGLPSGLTFNGSSTPDGNGGSSGSWTLAGKALVPAGTYTVRVTITDPQGGSRSHDITVTVTKEDMTIEYTGIQFLNTSKAGGTVTLPVSAKVTEAADGNLGTKPYSQIPLKLRFTLKNFNNAVVGTCDGNVNDAGVATCSFSALKADIYTVQVSLLDNGYYDAPIVDVAVTIADPGNGFVTGGGWITDPGQVPSATAGSRDNFGFTVKFLKNGGIQGNSNFIYRTVTNLYALGVTTAPNDTRSYNFMVKSNSMTGLQQTGGSAGKCTPTAPCYALFNGKSNLRAVDQKTGIEYAIDSSVIGNQQSFQVEVTDRSEPGSGQTPPQDSYAIRVWTNSGTFYQAGTVTSSLSNPGNQIVLGGGNIQVHL